MLRVDAPHPAGTGVNVIGYFHGQFGGGEVTRMVVSALKERSIPYALISIDGLAKEHNQEKVEEVLAERPVYPINIFCINTPQIYQIVSKSKWKGLSCHYNISLCFWETDVIPNELKRALRYFDEIWVASAYNQASLSAAVAIPVKYMPQPVQLNYQLCGAKKANFGLDDRFAFLFCFDFLSVFERKNPLGIVRAFRKAFEGQHEVQLVIKSQNGYRFPALLQSAREEIAADPRIHWIDESFSSTRRYELMEACDCYASLHRSEGFGLTMAEAMLMGKPVIATGYSGNLAFMTEDNSYLCRYNLIPIGPGQGPYPKEGLWADPDLDQAALWMRRVVENRNEAKEKAQKGREDVMQNHSFEAVGKKMEHYLTKAPACFRKKKSWKSRSRHFFRFLWGVLCHYANAVVRRLKLKLERST